MNNPFKFGGEVSGYQFYDRTEIAETLRRRLVAGSSNIVMFAPRRYGKTSLVSRVLHMLKVMDGIPSLLFDLSMVPTMTRFCEEYVNSVYAMVGGRKEFAHHIVDFLASCNPSLTIGVGDAVKIKLDLRDVLSESSLCEILDLPEKLAIEQNRTFVIAFDEFQEIGEMSRAFALEQVFRSRIQKQRHVRYVFFGSKTHLLERMFHDHARPFYNAALVMPLGKPPEDESREFVRSHFADAGIHVGDAAMNAILGSADNIPYYLQAVSSFVFESVTLAGRDEVTEADIRYAQGELLSANATYYATLLRGLSDAQKDLVLALAQEPVGTFDETYRRRHGLPSSSTLHSALVELIGDGIVEEDGKAYHIGDPVLTRYILASPGVAIP